MAIPDARTRNKLTLKDSSALFASIPRRVFPRIFLSNGLFVYALHASKAWLMRSSSGKYWTLVRVLVCGGLAAAIWGALKSSKVQRAKAKTEWSVLATASVLLLVQQACLFMVLDTFSSARVILFSQFPSYWLQALMNRSFTSKTLAIGMAFLLSVISDFSSSHHGSWGHLNAYGALLLYALSSNALEHSRNMLVPKLGFTFTVSVSILGASFLALPLYIFRQAVLGFPDPTTPSLLASAIIPLTAYSVLFLFPHTSRNLSDLAMASQHFIISYPMSLVFTIIAGALTSSSPSWIDALVAFLLFFGMYPESLALPPSFKTSSLKIIKPYIQTIVSNPESRKIFYFLMLNMGYMLVQMICGVWTNSLGLISDAIHMAFDCMAIAVGLFASIMATWAPNEHFTYGYGRIETLSGFANGVFLILISIFIVFEAIQRLLEPPEMNTNQLLLVSSVGLAINLFGMFAMGGHHHGGHSHNHSHSHTHSQKHITEHPQAIVSDDTLSEQDLGSHSHSPTHGGSPSGSTRLRQSPQTTSHLHPPTPIQEAARKAQRAHKRPFAGPQLQLDDLASDFEDVVATTSPGTPTTHDSSPITPNYKFGEDDHFEEHHSHRHAPNLHDHSHVHHHHHSHGHSHNMRGVFLHVMADTLGSVGVILSTLLIQFYGWTGFDPIASLFIAALIAASVFPLVMDTAKILCLDVADRQESIHAALAELTSIEGLASYTSPRFWPKDASSLIGTIHIQLSLPHSSAKSGRSSTLEMNHVSVDRVVEDVDNILRKRIFGLQELTIQVEEMQALSLSR